MSQGFGRRQRSIMLHGFLVLFEINAREADLISGTNWKNGLCGSSHPIDLQKTFEKLRYTCTFFFPRKCAFLSLMFDAASGLSRGKIWKIESVSDIRDVVSTDGAISWSSAQIWIEGRFDGKVGGRRKRTLTPSEESDRGRCSAGTSCGKRQHLHQMNLRRVWPSFLPAAKSAP